jgi:hypothetical protein
MSALNQPITKRIATLFCLLFSNFEGEALGALAAMKRLFAAEGRTPHDIAIVIENANGEIEELKYSDSDAEAIFARGIEEGRKQNAGHALSTQYFDADGEPRWAEIAKFCQSNEASLNPKEQEFVDEIPSKLRWRMPSRGQGGFLLSIFWKLRGSLKWQ